MIDSRPSAASGRFPLGALLLLSAAVLVTVTAESTPAGLLPEMSDDLGVGSEAIGLLISVWAVTVIVTSLPLARVVSHVDRRRVLAVSLAVFAAANVGTAIAPDYGLVMASRIAAATAHGVFWAVVIVYATSLLDPRHLARGLAIVTAGGTAATLIGLPSATLLAQTVGWRVAFALIGALALLLAVVMVRGRASRPPAAPSVASRGFRGDRSLPVLLILGMSAVLISTAQFAAFTYIRPLLEVSASIDAGWSSAILLGYGTAGMVGVLVAGILGDRFPRAALPVVLVLFAVSLGGLSLGAGLLPVVFAALVGWGIAFGAAFPLLQTLLMRTATDRTRTFASAGIVVMFNIGIALGPWWGGVVGGAEAPARAAALAALAMAVAAALAVVGVVLAARLRRQGLIEPVSTSAVSR